MKTPGEVIHPHRELWDAISVYVRASGGNTIQCSEERMNAVVEVDKELRAAARAAREPLVELLREAYESLDAYEHSNCKKNPCDLCQRITAALAEVRE